MTEAAVAVDVGNSAIKLGYQRDAKLCETAGADEASMVTERVPLAQVDWTRRLIEWMAAHRPPGPLQWRLASVHRRAADRLCQCVADRWPDDQTHRIAFRDVPMPARVDHPDQLGIDRLLGAYAAHGRFGGPLVIVDAGSAVTVDWVNAKGEFCGGAILPGLELQFSVLAAATDALPKIDFTSLSRPTRPATNTADAIALGVVTGIAAAVERLARDYAARPEHAGGNCEPGLVLTGGNAKLFSEHIERSHEVCPHLVLQGLLDLPDTQSPSILPADQLD